MKSAFIIAIVSVAMIGVMVPSGFSAFEPCNEPNMSNHPTCSKVYTKNIDVSNYCKINEPEKRCNNSFALSGALSGADLSDVVLTHWNGMRSNLSGTDLSRADLSFADLSFADLSGTNLSGATLYRADLSGTDLSRANLSGTDLSRANLSGTDLSRANLSGTDLSGTNLSGATLYRADLSGTDLSVTTLYRADLSGTDLSGRDLSGTNLSRANLSGADLSRANLSGADLSDTNLSGATLSGATLSGATLSGAIFSAADLSQDALSGIVIPNTNVSITGTYDVPKEKWIESEGLDGRSWAEVAEIDAAYRKYMGESKPAAPRAEYEADKVLEQSSKTYRLEILPKVEQGELVVSRSNVKLDERNEKTIIFNSPTTSVEKYPELSPEESKQRMKEMFGGSGLPMSKFSKGLKDPYPTENEIFDRGMMEKTYGSNAYDPPKAKPWWYFW